MDEVSLRQFNLDSFSTSTIDFLSLTPCLSTSLRSVESDSCLLTAGRVVEGQLGSREAEGCARRWLGWIFQLAIESHWMIFFLQKLLIPRVILSVGGCWFVTVRGGSSIIIFSYPDEIILFEK